MNEWTNKRTNEQCTRSYGIHKLYGITTFIQMEMEIHIHHRLHASAAFFLSLLSKLLLSFFNKIYNNNNHSRAKPSLSLLLSHFSSVTQKLLRCRFFWVDFVFEWKLMIGSCHLNLKKRERESDAQFSWYCLFLSKHQQSYCSETFFVRFVFSI